MIDKLIDTESLVIKDIRTRQMAGIAKYGTTLADNPLEMRLWLQHAYEECIDMALYLKRTMQELDREADDLK